MFGRALLPLLARPKAMALVALGIAATLSPMLLLMALGIEEFDQTERAVTAILLAGASLGWLGFACGNAIRQVSRCSFAWTAPRFRRRLRLEFMASGLGLAMIVSLFIMLAVKPALDVFPVVLLASVAGLALGCAFITVPDSPLLAPLLIVASFAFRVRWLEAAVERPLGFAAVATVIAVIAVWATFSTRTFRWAALRETASPLAVRTVFWLAARRRARNGPARLAPAARSDAHAAVRLSYAVTTGGRMIAMSRATGPLAWLLLLAAGPLTGFLFAVFLRIVGPDLQYMVGAMAVGALGFLHVLPPSQVLRAVLPWSRRDHLVATWSWHAAMAGWYALVASPSFVLVVRALDSPRWTTADAALMVGSALLLFPVSWGLLHRQFGQPHLVFQRSVLLAPVFQLGAPAIAALVFVVVPTSPARVATVWGLVLASQVVHWLLLKRDFARRDLAGASI